MDEGFDDGGVYTLYLGVASFSSSCSSASSSFSPLFEPATSSPTQQAQQLKTQIQIQQTQHTQQTLAQTPSHTLPTLPTQPIPLAKYDGSNTDLSAPSWTSLIQVLSPSSRLVFVEKREVVEAVLRSVDVATEGVREGDLVSGELNGRRVRMC